MSYILQVIEAGFVTGFVCVPNRRAENPTFVTPERDNAERFRSRDKAAIRAARFNSMNEHRGRYCVAVPYVKETNHGAQ